MPDETLHSLEAFVARHDSDPERFLAFKDPLLVVEATEGASGTPIIPVAKTKQGKKSAPSWSVALVAKRPGSNPFGFVSVGRAPNNDIVIPAASISKFNCYFVTASGGYGLVDAGSTTGTKLEDQPLVARGQPLPVADGALIQLGEVVTARFLEPRSFVEYLTRFGFLKRK